VSDAALFVGALTARGDLLDLSGPRAPPRIGLCRTHDWNCVDYEARAALEDAARVLRVNGAVLGSVDLPDDFAALGEAHAAIFGYEVSRSLAYERLAHGAQLTPRLLREIEAGDGVTAARYAAAQRLARECRQRFPEVAGDYDVLIAPSATGEAPLGLDSTGSPVMNRIWTLLHVPCVNVPCGRGSHGLPLGMQVIGQRGEDARTLAVAAWIQERLDFDRR
jgi:Asp-tRNA(Asn)/Glu-tRNA(Gln) amidotransferase A subunit family amidase